ATEHKLGRKGSAAKAIRGGTAKGGGDPSSTRAAISRARRIGFTIAMSAKRIRCECGRVYEPAKHSVCPACGAPPMVATVEPPKSTPEEKQPLVRQKDSDVREEDAQPIAINRRTLAIAGGAIFAVLALILF